MFKKPKIAFSFSLFQTPPEDVNKMTVNEIGAAVRAFCQKNVSYDGRDIIQVDTYTKQPLIFFLLERHPNASPDEQTTICTLMNEVQTAFSNSAELLKLKFNELYMNACTETPYCRGNLISQMQTLVDLGCISINNDLLNTLQKPLPMELEDRMSQGFWIRMISDLDQEKKVLDKREDLSEEAVVKIGHTRATQKSPYYTPYSPANFVSNYASYVLYQELGTAGVMIDTGAGPFAYWHDGTGYEMLSSQIDFNKKVLFNKENNSKQFSNIYKSSIITHIQTLKDKHTRDCLNALPKHHITDSHTGLDLNIPILFQPRQWNEGLLRYKKSHIFGIYVDSENKNSVIAGIKLQTVLNLPHIPFYGFSKFNHTLCQYSVNDLMQQHHLSADVITCSQSLLQLQQHYFWRAEPITSSATPAKLEHDNCI